MIFARSTVGCDLHLTYTRAKESSDVRTIARTTHSAQGGAQQCHRDRTQCPVRRQTGTGTDRHLVPLESAVRIGDGPHHHRHADRFLRRQDGSGQPVRRYHEARQDSRPGRRQGPDWRHRRDDEHHRHVDHRHRRSRADMDAVDLHRHIRIPRSRCLPHED